MSRCRYQNIVYHVTKVLRLVRRNPNIPEGVCYVEFNQEYTEVRKHNSEIGWHV